MCEQVVEDGAQYTSLWCASTQSYSGGQVGSQSQPKDTQRKFRIQLQSDELRLSWWSLGDLAGDDSIESRVVVCE